MSLPSRRKFVDPSFNEAFVEAFSREGEGIRVDLAHKLYPAQAAYIHDDGEGFAFLDADSLLLHTQERMKGEVLTLSTEVAMTSAVERNVRRLVRVLLLIVVWCLPLLVGFWVAMTHVATTQTAFQNVASIVVGLLVAYFGYCLLLLIFAFRAASDAEHHSPSEH